MEFLSEQKFLFGDLAAFYDTFEDLYNKKLWHQLTDALEAFVNDTNNIRGENLYDLYNHFIAKFESKLSQLRLSHIISVVGKSFNDPDRAISFYNRMLESRARLGQEASLCIEADVIYMKIINGSLEESRILIDQILDALKHIEPNEAYVFSKVYRAIVEFRKVAGPPQEFFSSSLLYLAYTPIETIPQREKYMLATDMALAAICGDGLYNFGEVLATPILASLADTPNSWLNELVHCLYNGDIDTFNKIVNENREAYFNQPALKNSHENVKQKIVLLALTNMIFKVASHERCLKYSDIAQVCRISVDQVDWVIMRAMSVGLVKGTIDEVSQTVNVTWIQPRVLDKQQLQVITGQLEDWTARVRTILTTVEDHTVELFV